MIGSQDSLASTSSTKSLKKKVSTGLKSMKSMFLKGRSRKRSVEGEQCQDAESEHDMSIDVSDREDNTDNVETSTASQKDNAQVDGGDVPSEDCEKVNAPIFV